MKNCSQSFLFTTKLSQIIRNGSTITITVYQDRLSLSGLKKSSGCEKFDKDIDFQTTHYVLNWDYSIHSKVIEGFSLCKQNKRRYIFSGSSDQLSQLKNILGGLMAFSDWEKDFKFVKHIRNNQKCQIILAKHENQYQVLKLIDFLCPNNSNNYTIQTSEELRALKLIQKNPHNNIHGFNSYYIDEMKCFLVMDYLSQGTLYDLQKKYNYKIPINIIQEVMQQILEGLNHLHQLKIIHRDIKYDNIMVASFNPIQIKIIDLGLCVIDNSSNSRAGTGGYIAPEVFQSTKITDKIDIFSAGAVFHKLLVGKPIYDDLVQNQNGNIRINSHIQNQNALDLLHQMLNFDPKLRYSAYDCLAHPFFTDESDSLSSKTSLYQYLSPKQVKLQVFTPATDFITNQNIHPFKLN
ncbi:unnamed protein product [Paramecium sonneborni]|uniref:Protein kinase domain-containing protein n=1 Tax=Paramecium sonneborni TaxID=65129 RepID=A0A8S1R677_9CILI|nr:unnamed protein product [Paramecium sonneborni]